MAASIIKLTVCGQQGKSVSPNKTMSFAVALMTNIIDSTEFSGASKITIAQPGGANILYNVTQTQTEIGTLANEDTIADLTIVDTLTVQGEGIFQSPNKYAGATAITAHAGGGIGSATALTEEKNNIGTCATAADSVLLPVAALGKEITVINNGVAACDVFAVSGSQINGAGDGVAVSIPAGGRKVFVGTSATTWVSGTRTSQGKGTAALPAITFDAQPNMGLYWISSTAMGISVGGVLQATLSTTGLTLVGFLTVPGALTTQGATIFGGTPQTLTGAGAISLATRATLLVTTSADALTLAAGAEGQQKLIKMKTDGGDGTLTPNALQGGTTITFNDAGDFVLLEYLDAKWNILCNSGCTVA